jgi:DNA-binding beta-propeller fold protein YncE
MPKTRWVVLAVLALSCAGLGTAAGADDSGFRILKRIPIGGDGGWDYLTMDAASRRLYVSRATRVLVVDVDQGKLVGEIPNTPSVHGIALAPRHKRGFTSNGGDSTVTIFELDTLKEIARPKVGTGPDAILYDPATDRVFTLNARSQDATALDAGSGSVVGTVKLGGKPEFAVADGKGQIFVNLEDKNEIVGFDAKDLTVKTHWPLAPGKTPTGLAIDPAKRRLFSACRSEVLVVLDMDSGRVLGTPKIGKGTDGAAFDPGTGLAFASNGDGTLNVIEEQPAGQFRVLATVTTPERSKTMTLDPKTHHILLGAARFKPATGGGRPQQEPNSFEILVVGK